MLLELFARSLRAAAPGAMAAWLGLVVLALNASGVSAEPAALYLLPGATALQALVAFLCVGMVLVPFMRDTQVRPAPTWRARLAVVFIELVCWAALTFGLAEAATWLVPERFAYRPAIARVAISQLALVPSALLAALATRRMRRGAAFPLWPLCALHVLARIYTSQDLALVWPGHDVLLDALSALFCAAAASRRGPVPPHERAVVWGIPALLSALLVTLALAVLRPWSLSVLADSYPGPAGALAELRGVYDLDGDGFPALLGGFDCNDDAPLVSPMGLEVVGNGIDDNCMGGDLPSYVPPLEATRQPHAPQHSVVLIVIDTLRADVVAGRQRPAPTPALDAFAARAACFERAYSHAPYTGQALRALMTGQYPMSLNSFEVSLGWEPSLAGRLRSAGYQTSAIVQFDELQRRSGAQADGSQLLMEFERTDWSLRARNVDFRGVTSAATTDLALKEVERLRGEGRPFLLWVHYFDPHAEYMTHPNTPFGEDTLEGRYLQEVFSTDREVGRLLERLESVGYYADGLTAITGDHGELLGEGGHFQHALWLEPGALHVPLLLRGPGVSQGRYRTRVRHIDLTPTLLELAAGIRAPSPGRSLAELWRRGDQTDRDLVAVSTYDRRVIKRAIWRGAHALELDVIGSTRALYIDDELTGRRKNVLAQHPDVADALADELGHIWDRAMNDRVMVRRLR